MRQVEDWQLADTQPQRQDRQRSRGAAPWMSQAAVAGVGVGAGAVSLFSRSFFLTTFKLISNSILIRICSESSLEASPSFSISF